MSDDVRFPNIFQLFNRFLPFFSVQCSVSPPRISITLNQNQLFYFQMRSAVRNVAKYFPTAIITGRNRDKVGGELLRRETFAFPYYMLIIC